MSGFMPFGGLTDEEIYANAFLWVVENVCPRQLDGINYVKVSDKNFGCELVLTSGEDSGQENVYYCQADFRIADGKLLFFLSDVLIESSVFVMKKVTPLEKLIPEKKDAHKRILDDFVQVESEVLNRMFDYVAAHRLSPVTHWKEIAIRKPVKGMTQEECRLAFGKPQTVLETNGEVQWMYTSSFYLFFKDGYVQTVIK